MSEFKPGDLVRLKSGGPVMTGLTEEYAGVLTCRWFREDSTLGECEFPIKCLEKVELGYVSQCPECRVWITSTGWCKVCNRHTTTMGAGGATKKYRA